MNPHRLQCLVATVPDTIGPEQRSRLDAHVEAVSSCCSRIAEVRHALRRALDGRGGSALDLARELDSLERVQDRLDRHLTELVAELGHTGRAVYYGDGVPV